jgi:hypothetical protein
MAYSIHDDSDSSGEIMRGDNVATLVIQESLLTLMGDSGED